MRASKDVPKEQQNRLLTDIGYADYAQMAAINAHGLMDVLESPFSYQEGLRQAKEPSRAMRLGIHVDMALFEPELFAETVHVGNKKHAEGKEAVTPLYMATVQAIVAGIKKNFYAAQLLAEGIPQPTVVWQDRFHKVLCKARLDFISHLGGRRIAVDLKTTADANPDKFARKAAEYRYDLQAAHYLEAGRATGLYDADLFMFIVVETKAPYRCLVYQAGDSVLSRGVAWRDHAMQLYAECLRKDSWPESGQFHTLEMPFWAKLPDEQAEADRRSPLEANDPPPDDNLDEPSP